MKGSVSLWSLDDWRKWSALDGADRRLLVEAAAALALARLSLRTLHFRRAATLFRLRLRVLDDAGPAPLAPDAAARPAWAVRAAAPRMPFRAECLVQALAGSAMLRRRDIPTTIHLGVAKDHKANDGLTAHAWLRCGPAVLTGAGGLDAFTPIAAFDVRPGRAPKAAD